MSTPGPVVLRRTWPQRLVILLSLGVVAAALASAWFINDVFVSITSIGRVPISREILITDTVPGEPVNFLVIGEDSALGLDPDDPAAYAREVDPRGRFQADSIAIIRVDPTSGQVWVVSVPRDLLVDVGGGRIVKINSTLLIDGPDLLISSISETFGVTINHFITLDFLGFQQLIDELDGVPVWFDNPARDINLDGNLGSGLFIDAPGCRVLNGREALQYVRSRGYQELIDGEWQYVGRRDDFGRIERQQDFLVLALDRAIARGARNPVTLSALIEAGAGSIRLDPDLTIAELIDVGEAFADFDPENLQRFGLEVTTEYDSNNRYLGELLIPGRNDAVFDVFRGAADLPAPESVAFDLYGSTEASITLATEQFSALGFGVADRFVVDGAGEATVIVHPPGSRAAAETVARWLEPIPRIVEDTEATSISVVLGADHEQILFLYPHEIPKMRGAVAAHDDSSAPDLSEARPADATTTSDSPSSTTTTPPAVTTTVGSTDESATPTTTVGIIGQAPEGETCG